MKDFDSAILILLGVAVSGALIIGVVTAIKKSFNRTPTIVNSNKDALLRNQRKRMREIEENQDRTMQMLEDSIEGFEHQAEAGNPTQMFIMQKERATSTKGNYKQLMEERKDRMRDTSR